MVRTKITRLGLSVAIALALTTGSVAAESVAVTDVRATGMGGSATATASGVSSLFSNPAGLGQKKIDFTINAESPSTESLSGAQVLLKHTPTADDFAQMGNGMAITGMTGIGFGPVGVATAVNGAYTVNQDLKTASSQVVSDIAVGMGTSVAKTPLIASEVRLGLAGHFLNGSKSNYNWAGAKVDTDSKEGKGFYLSAGAIARITPLVTLGVSVKNLAYHYEWTNEGVETLQPVYTGGVAVKVPMLGITVAGDIDTASNLHYGAETNMLFNLFSLRAGQSKPKSGATVTSLGASMNFGPFSAGVATETSAGQPNRLMVEGSVRF